MPNRYPLDWPAGWPRSGRRRHATFKVDYSKMLRELDAEIHKLGGTNAIVSSNRELRLDGMPRQDKGEPLDPGVALYFELKGRQKVFACDTYTTVRDNLRAISLTLESLRAISRYGATTMLERAMSSFDALPPPRTHWDVLGIRRGANVHDIERAWRERAKTEHPDAGGSTTRMAELNSAKDAAIREVTA